MQIEAPVPSGPTLSASKPVPPAAPAAQAAATDAHASSATGFPNPTLRLDPGLGMVVLQFRNSAGTVTNSIPSERQLAAYRTKEESSAHPGTTQKTG